MVAVALEQEREVTLNPVTLVDRQALALFDADSTDEYKRMAIYLVYRTIETNPSITIKSIKWVLRKYGIAKELVDKAVTILISSELFNAIHYWKSTNAKGVKLYKVNPDNELMSQWLGVIDSAQPELSQFNVKKPK